MTPIQLYGRLARYSWTPIYTLLRGLTLMGFCWNFLGTERKDQCDNDERTDWSSHFSWIQRDTAVKTAWVSEAPYSNDMRLQRAFFRRSILLNITIHTTIRGEAAPLLTWCCLRVCVAIAPDVAAQRRPELFFARFLKQLFRYTGAGVLLIQKAWKNVVFYL